MIVNLPPRLIPPTPETAQLYGPLVEPLEEGRWSELIGRLVLLRASLVSEMERFFFSTEAGNADERTVEENMAGTAFAELAGQLAGITYLARLVTYAEGEVPEDLNARLGRNELELITTGRPLTPEQFAQRVTLAGALYEQLAHRAALLGEADIHLDSDDARRERAGLAGMVDALEWGLGRLGQRNVVSAAYAIARLRRVPQDDWLELCS